MWMRHATWPSWPIPFLLSFSPPTWSLTAKKGITPRMSPPIPSTPTPAPNGKQRRWSQAIPTTPSSALLSMEVFRRPETVVSTSKYKRLSEKARRSPCLWMSFEVLWRRRLWQGPCGKCSRKAYVGFTTCAVHSASHAMLLASCSTTGGDMIPR